MSELMIGKTSDGLKMPVNVDANGRVVISGTVSSIGNVETILNTQTAIETVMAADLALTKGYAQVTKGSGAVDSNTQRVTLASDGPGVANLSTIATNTARVPGFSLPAYDYLSLSYTSGNVTGVVYKTGGASGTTVATLTLAYSGSDLISVTKS